MELIEVAPGIDIERDILAQMGFAPIIARSRSRWIRACSATGRWDWSTILLGLSLAERISYDAERNTLFVNFEGFQVRTIEDVDLVRREFERALP